MAITIHRDSLFPDGESTMTFITLKCDRDHHVLPVTKEERKLDIRDWTGPRVRTTASPERMRGMLPLAAVSCFVV